MWLIICWLFGLRSILYHFLVALLIITVLVCYKLFSNNNGGQRGRNPIGHLNYNQYQLLLASAGCDKFHKARLGERFKLVIMRRLESLSNANVDESGLAPGKAGKNKQDNNHINPMSEQRQQYRHSASRSAVAHLSLANLCTFSNSSWLLVVLLALACSQWQPAMCLEEDAQIMTPVANLAKSIIKTVTLGVPLEVSLDTSGIVKNFAYLTWRTGFPVSMPSGFMQKAADFYNRVRERVARAPVEKVERKSLANLRFDLDAIVDGIVEQVRRSPDGLYTDYLQARIEPGNVPLEDACTLVGLQLKAYGVDLTNYRDIAGKVLGIPVMPRVASAVVNMASLGQSGLGAVQNLTSMAIVGPLNATATGRLLARVPLGPASVLINGQSLPFTGLLFGNKQQQPQQLPPLQQV